MFKELGAFIDEVGKSTGRGIKGLVSDKDDKDDDEMMGLIVPHPNEKIELKYHSGKHIKGRIVDGKIVDCTLVDDEDDTNERSEITIE